MSERSYAGRTVVCSGEGHRSSILPGAPPPIAAFFLGRVVIWVVLVCACALPLVMVTAGQFTPAERSAEWQGVLGCAVAMVIIGEGCAGHQVPGRCLMPCSS